MTRDGILRRTALAGLVSACLVSTAVLAGPSQASPRAGTQGSPPSDVGWVTGTVVDGNGDPVVGDLVSATGPREVPESGILSEHSARRDFTDENGAFRVRQASPHGYLVAICNPEPSYKKTCRETAQGVDHLITYVGPAGVSDSWVLQTSLFPTAGADRDLGTVTVKPQSFVHGTLQRAANQSIRLMRLNGTVAYYNSTDELGNYRFQGLAPGRYRVAGGGDGWRPWQSDIFTVEPGGDLEVDGVLDRGAAIHGVVRSAGQPVPFLDIFVRRSGGRLVAVTTTNENGYYRVSGLLPGSFRVGVTYDGSDYRRHSVAATITDPHGQAAAKLNLVKGAVITVALRAGGQPAIRASDELRDSSGHAILGQRNVNGQVAYPGLSPGDYTVVAGNDTHFMTARVHVTGVGTYDLGTRVLNRPTLTLSGTTAPGAVVEASTGNQCPPDGPVRPGSFQFLEQADASGRYVINGVVPGRYMLGVDGYPANYVPYCRSDVPITHDRRAALPLEVGGYGLRSPGLCIDRHPGHHDTVVRAHVPAGLTDEPDRRASHSGQDGLGIRVVPDRPARAGVGHRQARDRCRPRPDHVAEVPGDLPVPGRHPVLLDQPGSTRRHRGAGARPTGQCSALPSRGTVAKVGPGELPRRTASWGYGRRSGASRTR